MADKGKKRKHVDLPSEGFNLEYKVGERVVYFKEGHLRHASYVEQVLPFSSLTE